MMSKIVKLFLFIIILVGIYIPSEVVKSAEAPTWEKKDYTKEGLIELTDIYANMYNVSPIIMKQVISCESGWNINAIGDSGKSFGLVQIHNPSHPSITQEEAINPEFAINFLAENLSKGRGSMWTCYRKLNIEE